jgi:hypothetical protein
MKVTVVPAQVTTVEDRIVGSLGFSQLVLIVSPVFIAAALFAVLPPVMGSAVYKYVIMGILAFLCCLLAIRIKGKILAAWLVVILRYNLRPKYYLFDKNVTTLRENYPVRQEKKEQVEVPIKVKSQESRPRLGIPETAKILATIENPAAKVRFETGKKGNLHVRLTEIEE